MTVHLTKCYSATVSNAAAVLNFKKRVISNCKIWVEQTLTDGAMQYRVQHCRIAFIPSLTESEGVKAYKLNNSQEIKNTILIYRRRKVIDKFVNYDGDDVKLLL